MNIQINPSNMLVNQISLNDKIKKILSAKLTPSQIEAGYVCTKELTYILSCTEKTLSRWRQMRKNGNKNVGIPCYQIMGKYRYFLDDIVQYFIDNMI